MNLEAILIDASLYLTQHCLHMLYWNSVLHPLKAHHARRYIQTMARVDLVNGSDTHC